jgi:imidazole glycerol-phosphate synthase subunit HisH
MSKIAIVDYGMCNLDSVARAIEMCGGKPVVTDRPEDLGSATHIILPGVGAFRDAMFNLRRRGLDVILRKEVVENNIPFLGICLGMQLLAIRSWEGGENTGLGWLDGEVRRLEPKGQDYRIPHIGWNEVNFGQDAPLFRGIASGKDFYFVHSYHFRCRDAGDVMAYTPYCGGFVSAVRTGHILGVQFHPEKSQRVGLQLLNNFMTL